MKSLPAAAIGFPMLFTLIAVSTLGYARGAVVGVLLFVAAFVVILIGVIKHLNSKQKPSIIPIIALIMCALSAMSYTTQARQNDTLASRYAEAEGYARGTVVDILGYDGTYRYVIKCDDGFTFLLNTSVGTNAKMYDRFEGNVSFCRSSEITIEEPIQAYCATENIKFYSTSKTGIKGVVYNIRQYAIECIDKYIPNQAGALVKGVLLGDESSFDFYLEQDFTVVGLAHLLVISGSHLSVFVTVSMLFLPLGINRRRFAWTVIIPMIFYMMLCGMGPSVVRAGICSGIFALSYTFKRDVTPLNSLGAAAMLVGIFWPQGAVSMGFLLSFFSTLGAVLFYQPVESKIQNTKLPKILKLISKPAVLTVTAQLFITPIIVMCYGRLSIVTVLANVLVGGLIGAVMCISLIAILLSALIVTQPLTALAAYFAKWIAALCLGIVNCISDVFDANVTVSKSETMVCICLICLGGIFAFCAGKRRGMFKLGIATIVISLLLLSAVGLLASDRVVINSLNEKCVVIRYKEHALTVGECLTKKESTYLTRAVYGSGDKRADVLDLHMCDTYKAQSMANISDAHCVIIPENVKVTHMPYEVSKDNSVVTVSDDFIVTADKNYTYADIGGFRIAVAQEGADLTGINNIDCVIARGECKADSKYWIVYNNTNALAIGDGRVYNTINSDFEVTVDRYFGIMQ